MGTGGGGDQGILREKVHVVGNRLGRLWKRGDPYCNEIHEGPPS